MPPAIQSIDEIMADLMRRQDRIERGLLQTQAIIADITAEIERLGNMKQVIRFTSGVN